MVFAEIDKMHAFIACLHMDHFPAHPLVAANIFPGLGEENAGRISGLNLDCEHNPKQPTRG